MEEKREIKVFKNDDAAEEAILISLARKGGRQAFGQLVRLHQKRILRMAMGMIGDLDVAMDITQEAFMRAWQAMEGFQEGRPFYPWISTIATNLALNHLQRSKREISLDAQPIDRADSGPGPLETIRMNETDRRFMEAVEGLPEEYRVVFVLRSLEDLSYEEIARRLKISVGTVDSRLFRARRLLVEALKEFLE